MRAYYDVPAGKARLRPHGVATSDLLPVLTAATAERTRLKYTGTGTTSYPEEVLPSSGLFLSGLCLEVPGQVP